MKFMTKPFHIFKDVAVWDDTKILVFLGGFELKIDWLLFSRIERIIAPTQSMPITSWSLAQRGLLWVVGWSHSWSCLKNRADFTNADWWQLCQAKMVVFKFINCYCSLYYIAFLKEKGFHWNVCKRRELEARFFFKFFDGIPNHRFTGFYFSVLVHLLHHLWIQLYLFEWFYKHNLSMRLNVFSNESARVHGTTWIAGHIPIPRSIAGCLACQWPVSMTIVWCLRMSCCQVILSLHFFNKTPPFTQPTPQKHTTKNHGTSYACTRRWVFHFCLLLASAASAASSNSCV